MKTINGLTYLEGSLLDSSLLRQHNVIAIAHCANCFNTMGSGIAGHIRRDLPYACKADMLTVSGDRKKAGTFSVGEGTRNDTIWTPDVYNLYGQYSYGAGVRQVNYEWMYRALESMAETLYVKNIGINNFKIGFPYKMASDLAGGNWNIIQELVKQAFERNKLRENVIIFTIEGFPAEKA